VHEAYLLEANDIVGGKGSPNVGDLSSIKELVGCASVWGCSYRTSVYFDLDGLVDAKSIPDASGPDDQNQEQSER